MFAILLTALIQVSPEKPTVTMLEELTSQSENHWADFSVLPRIQSIDPQLAETLNQYLLQDGIKAFEAGSKFREIFKAEMPSLLDRAGIRFFCDESQVRRSIFTQRDCELILGRTPEDARVCYYWARNNLVASSKMVVGRFYTSGYQPYWELEGCGR